MSFLPEMGKYGAYVWPAYTAVIVILGALAVQSWRWQRKVREEADKLKAARRASLAEAERFE